MTSLPLALRIPLLCRTCFSFSASPFANLFFSSNIVEISHGLITGLASSNLSAPIIPTLLSSPCPVACPPLCLSITAYLDDPSSVHWSDPPILLLLTIGPLQGIEMSFGNTHQLHHPHPFLKCSLWFSKVLKKKINPSSRSGDPFLLWACLTLQVLPVLTWPLSLGA